ncbi:MAG: hypothetical protein GX640_21645 [Fibrobacter sp.]|nr:hypothetical protein [Fibrobacter sp.]
MSKKIVKQKTIPLHAMPPEQLQQLATKSMHEGKLRIARDAYKELIRIDRARFLPDLLHCYNLLAMQMAGNGQIVEANNLIAYIKELGGEAAVTVTIKSGKPGGNNKSFIFNLMNLIKSGEEVSPELKFKAADEAMANRNLPEDIEQSFRADFEATTCALAAICNSQFDSIHEILKPVTFDSAFSQWKLFLRGMSCYYTGDDQRAEKFFSKLPQFTVPAKLAKSILTLLDHKKYLSNDDSDRENVFKSGCILGGYAELADSIPRAEYLWMTKRYRDSFLHIDRTLTGFPALGTGIVANLTNFYFNSLHHLDEKYQERYIDVLTKLFSRFDRYKTTLIQFLSHRTMCLYSLYNYCCDTDDQIIDLWEHLYTMYEKLFGSDKYLQTEIYLMLGIHFSSENQHAPMHNPFLKKINEHDLRFAENCFLKAIEISKCKDAYLNLLKLYTTFERKKDCRQLLNDAVNTFPEDKDLLQTAGMMALTRNAVYKAAEYLERAFALDPIDTTLREQLSISYITAARQAAKSSTGLKKMRLYINKAESLCPDGGKGFTSEVRFIAIRKAALEFISGNESIGRSELQRALSLPGDRISIIYFGLQIFKSFNVPHEFTNALHVEVDKIFNSKPEIRIATIFLEVLIFTLRLQGNPSVSFERNRFTQYLIEALKADRFSQDDIRKYIDFAVSQNLLKLAETITKLAYKSDPVCPRYRFYKYKYATKKNIFPSIQKIQEGIKILNNILTDAQKANDLHTAHLISSELNLLKSQLRNPFPDIPFPPDNLNPKDLEEIFRNLSLLDGEDDEFDDDEFDFPFPGKSKHRKKPKKKYF